MAALLAPLAPGALAPLKAAAPPAAATAGAAPSGPVFLARLNAIIQPASAQFLLGALERADEANAAALVIELDTPGGLLTSTHEITKAMVAARTPVVVYVTPGGRAASAGFFLLMAADVAAMAPGTSAGAAHPVGPQGESIEGTVGKKVEQDAAASVRALAARSGKDPAAAEQAVVESRSFTASEALAAKLIDLVTPSLAELLHALDGRLVKKGAATIALHTAKAPLREVEMTATQKLLSALAHPNIAYLLLMLGGLGLFFELSHPGAVLPGVVGGIALILAFFGLSILDASYAGVALIVLALVLFVAEIKVMSHGMLTLAGVISLVLGSLMLFRSPEPALRVSLETIATLTVFALAVLGFLMRMAIRARGLPVRTGGEGLLRQHGVVRSPLAPGAPRGKVFVHGELWQAEAEEPVAEGETVEVVAVHDMILAVRPLRRAPATGGT